MSTGHTIRRLKDQRRRNAATIRERNETIRRLEMEIDYLRVVAFIHGWNMDDRDEGRRK